MNIADLSKPFPPEVISWRCGPMTQDKSKTLPLAYIDARDVMDRFDEVCGLNWQAVQPWSDGTKIACQIGVWSDELKEWIWRGDGAGKTDVEGDKGTFSDALKRAAVLFGVARYLYDVKAPWVKVEQVGRSYKIADSELPKLRALLSNSKPSSSSQGRVSPKEAQKPHTEAHTAPERDIHAYRREVGAKLTEKFSGDGPAVVKWLTEKKLASVASALKPDLDKIVKVLEGK